MPQVQISIDAKSAATLDDLARSLSLSREDMLREIILHYCDYDRWFREKVEEGDRAYLEGRYVSNEEAMQRSQKFLEKILAAKKVGV